MNDFMNLLEDQYRIVNSEEHQVLGITVKTLVNENSVKRRKEGY